MLAEHGKINRITILNARHLTSILHTTNILHAITKSKQVSSTRGQDPSYADSQ
jgi:uncharacterized protein YuzE